MSEKGVTSTPAVSEPADRIPPQNLGISLSRARMAAERGERCRYWPLRDMPCSPRVGFVQAAENQHGRDVLWMTGKSGYVLCSHVELLSEDVKGEAKGGEE